MGSSGLNYGTCHVEVYQNLLVKILNPKTYSYGLRVIKAVGTGEFSRDDDSNEIFYVELAAHKLPVGYHGVMNFIDLEPHYRLKSEVDT